MHQRTLIFLGVLVVALGLGCAFISEPDVGTSASGPDIYDDNGSFGEASGDGSDPYLNGSGVTGEDGSSVPSNEGNSPPDDDGSEPGGAVEDQETDFATSDDANSGGSFGDRGMGNDASTSDDAGTLQFDAGDFDAGVVGADAQFENDSGS